MTLERLKRTARVHSNIELLRDNFPWYAEGDPALSPTPPQCPHRPGAKRPRAAVELGSGAPVYLGRHLPRDSVAEIAAAIARHDAGWTREFRSDLERIDQYSGCGCEVVVTDPIDDVPAIWRDLESDRIALWERIRALSGYDLAQAQSSSDSQT